MPTPPKASRRSRAETFVSRLSITIDGVEAGPDVGVAIQRINEFLSERLASNEVERILDAFERALERDRVRERDRLRTPRQTASPRPRSPLGAGPSAERPASCDPYYWG